MKHVTIKYIQKLCLINLKNKISFFLFSLFLHLKILNGFIFRLSNEIFLEKYSKIQLSILYSKTMLDNK